MRKSGVVIYTDGGARGNPGPSGAGAAIYKDGAEVAHVSKYLGKQTNNFAEYEALVLALEAAVKKLGSPLADVLVRMDSELIVRQMKGEYRVKNSALKKQHERVRRLLGMAFPGVRFEHVRREENQRADELANEAMDAHHVNHTENSA